MTAFQWTQSLSVDIKHLDDHHKKLIGYLENLFDNMRTAEGQKVVESIIVDLVRYAQYHFNAEEELMKQHDFSGYKHHKQEHEAFVVKVTELYNKAQKGEPVVARTYEFMKAWLVDHISKTDKLYSAYLNTKGVK